MERTEEWQGQMAELALKIRRYESCFRDGLFVGYEFYVAQLELKEFYRCFYDIKNRIEERIRFIEGV